MSVLGRSWSVLARVNATLLLFIIAALVAYLGVTVVSAVEGERQAVQTAKTIALTSHERIVELQAEIKHLERTSTRRTGQIGALRVGQRILIRQLRKHKIVPAVIVHRIVKVTRTHRHHQPPRVKKQRTHTSPSPSPSCTPTPDGACLPLSKSALPGRGKHKGRLKHGK